ncbi:hypothetical protein SMA21_23160, partial [Escherichia coli]|uniref:hypothetical protein n=1 Tax=Escherichia coli TaxID=562 RepID=UPI00307A48BE
MKLFHGTYEKTVPIIKPGEFAMSGNNVFDGLFSSPERDIAASHGGTVAKLAMRQPFVLFKGLTFQKLCLPGAFRPG